MKDLVREEVLGSAHRVVIKVGTRVLTDSEGLLDLERIQTLAQAMMDLKGAGREVILVSSGAVGAGLGELGLNKRPHDVASLQALAAIGQARLIDAYNRALRERGARAAQVLLTAADLDRRDRYLNIRNAILKLQDFGVIPIVNENDTVAVEELVATFGDNDRLAALVTGLVDAPLLVILSDVAGLYDGDPGHADSKVVSVVEALDGREQQWVNDRLTGLSKGGMGSKLEAARIVTSVGGSVIVASGRSPDTLQQIFAGNDIGTLFLPKGKSIPSRKRWLGFSASIQGHLTLDLGACRALTHEGRSLLSIGVCEVGGNFEKGDVVRLLNEQGIEVARGLTNYAADDLALIQGLKSHEIAHVLGHVPYEEVVHRDNLILR